MMSWSTHDQAGSDFGQPWSALPQVVFCNLDIYMVSRLKYISRIPLVEE